MADTYIERVTSERDFTIIRNEVLQNPKLSFGARGFLAFLLSQPHSWKVPKIDDLTRYCPEGREKLYGYVRELMKAGHWHRFKLQFEDGSWGSVCVILEAANPSYDYSCWQSANPKAVQPKAAVPEAYKERKRKKQIASQSAPRKPGRPPKVKVPAEKPAKGLNPWPMRATYKLPPRFVEYATNLGLEEHEIVEIRNNWAKYHSALPNRMYEDGWYQKWQESVNKYIQMGRKYRNLKNLDVGGSNEQQADHGSASGARADALRRIVTDPGSIPRVRIN